MPETPKRDSHITETIVAARAGDEEALEALIRYYQDRVAGFVISLVGRDADFEDLCQVTFLKMALSLPKLRSPEVFEPWLFKIARNACRDHLRRLRLRRWLIPLSRDHNAIAAEEAPASGQDEGCLDRALQKLPRSQRELIGLLCEREYSYQELAQLMESSVRAVAGRLFRARTNLRKLLRYRGAER